MTGKILLLEDDEKLAFEIQKYFTNKNFFLQIAYDGLMMLKHINNMRYDIYILDINTPIINGLEVCKKIREEDKLTPVIMLTAFGEVSDKVEALKIGADDYVVKPFDFDELTARVDALLRRSNKPQNEADIITIANLKINLSSKKVSRGDKPIELSPKEFKLLEVLSKAGGNTVSKQTIYENLWDNNFDLGTNAIGVYINFLRNKIDKDFETKLIHTRPGFGYYLQVNDK